MPNKPILLLNVPYSILWTEHLHKNLKFSEIRWGIPQGPPDFWYSTGSANGFTESADYSPNFRYGSSLENF